MTTGYSANELSILADDQATLIPNDYAKSIIALAISMIVLDTIIVGLRVWTRAWYMRAHGAWGIDDTLIILGLVSDALSVKFQLLI